MRILLFDVDGTLLLTNGSGTRALGMALTEAFDVDDPFTDLDFRGRTDSSLFRELLQINGLQPSGENVSRLGRAYGDRLPVILQRHGGRILPGVTNLLEKLSTHQRIACYVMTGNLHETATQKLTHFQLHSHFRGIFGGDHDEDRRHLAERTAKVLEEKYGPIASEEVFVIGDTPEDVRCGEAIGARVLAVCTGNFSRSELEATAAHYVHDDLSNVEEIYHSLVSLNDGCG